MVLRRSTTRWTWPSERSSSERSTVTFIAASVHKWGSEGGAPFRFRQGRIAVGNAFSRGSTVFGGNRLGTG
jgi:hypothetical protein